MLVKERSARAASTEAPARATASARRLAAGEVSLGDEREHGGRVAQARAVVGARHALVALGLERGQRGGESPAGAGAVAEHRERRAELRLGERGRESVELGVGKIAQIADHRAAVAREHVERVGERLRVVLVGLARVDDRVAQPVERLVEGPLRNREIALAGAGEEIGDEGVEPGVVVAAVGRP